MPYSRFEEEAYVAGNTSANSRLGRWQRASKSYNTNLALLKLLLKRVQLRDPNGDRLHGRCCRRRRCRRFGRRPINRIYQGACFSVEVLGILIFPTTNITTKSTTILICTVSRHLVSTTGRHEGRENSRMSSPARSRLFKLVSRQARGMYVSLLRLPRGGAALAPPPPPSCAGLLPVLPIAVSAVSVKLKSDPCRCLRHFTAV